MLQKVRDLIARPVRAAEAAASSAERAAEAAQASQAAVERLVADALDVQNTPGQRIVLDYPVSPRPRFGHGLPAHPLISQILAHGEHDYRARIDQILQQAEYLHRLPIHEASTPVEPNWVNPWLPGLDTAALYTVIATEKPALYLEVGSGCSTKVVRRAISDHGLSTLIVSIDPQPRAEIDAICDEVVRSPLEDTDLSVFDQVQAGDVVFVDNSHRVFTNSDATVVFLEVLPRLVPGVWVQIHDIFLPDDYPADWNHRFYSEQYVLAGLLMGGHEQFSTEFPCWYVANHPELSKQLQPFFDPLEGVQRHGNSFWIKTR